MEEISYSGDRPARKRRLSRRALVFLGFFLAILILLGGLAFFLTRNTSTDQKTINLPTQTTQTPTPTPTISPTPENSPTPTVSAKESTLKVSVQNGSGEAGVAASAAAILRSAGYEVVSTGNADNFDYEGVTIQIKSSQKSLLADLKEDLSSDYTVSETSTDLSEDEAFDALVIVGK